MRGASRAEDKVAVYQYNRLVSGTKSFSTCANYAVLQSEVDHKESHLLAAKAIQSIFYMGTLQKILVGWKELHRFTRKTPETTGRIQIPEKS